MNIVKVDIENAPQLLEAGSIFSSKEWLALYPYSVEYYEVRNKNDECVGRFSMFRKKKAGLGYAITAPFSPHIGLSYELRSEKTATQNSERKKIHEAIAEFLAKSDEQLIELTFPPSEQDMQVYQWKGFQVSPRYTYHLSLKKSNDELLSEMSAERRKNIQKAKKDGLICERSGDVESFLSVLENTLEKAGAGYDRAILNEVLQGKGIDENRDLWLCKREDELLSCALIIREKEKAYYLLGGMMPDSGHEGAQALLLWEAMNHTRQKGCSIFDLEGSMIPAIERFFRGFGGEMVSYFQVERSTKVGKLASAIKKGLR